MRVTKTLATLGFLLLAIHGLAQEQPNAGGMIAPLPEELKMASFMLGEWTGKETSSFGGQKMESTSTATLTMMLNGRWVHGTHRYSMGGGPAIEGMHLMTYDPTKKEWTAWWFDGVSHEVMEMRGNFEGDKLIMISKPVNVPGMGAVTFRASWWKTSDKTIAFRLENKTGNDWSPAIVGEYTRK